MKNKKSNYKKMILPILTTSVTLYSCDSEFQEVQSLSMENFAEDTENGTVLLPIDIYIGDDYANKILFINSFVTNILSNYEEALLFSKDSDKILQKYKLDEIDLDRNSPEIQLLFALTDSEILKAIENNDVKGYMQLLKKKGLFQTEKFKRMVSLMNLSNVHTRKDICIPDDNNVSPFIICFLGAGIYVGLATVAETYVMVHHKFAMYGATAREISQLMTDHITETNVIKLWQLKGDSDHTYDITDRLHNSIVQLSADIANVCELTKEEQKTIFEISEGTINYEHLKDSKK